jgi:DNA modification methylase
MDKIFFGDCRSILKDLSGANVKAQTCVTSPPYFGLRDYGHKGQIGLEQTPEEYIAAMVEVFRCVRDVLADDGTLWLNIGDSYVATGGEYKNGSQGKTSIVGKTSPENVPGFGRVERRKAMEAKGLKQKDLIGIPWMLAFALRADGWYLRQDIIWHKPNPMPESVRDRCTKAHEYIFLLSKSERYYYDAEAVSETAICDRKPGQKITDTRKTHGTGGGNAGINSFLARYHEGNAPKTRNRRSVWTVATQPYSGAHFATFPPALIEPCILAGSRPGDIVLDPFMGSGTTAQVAVQHRRRYLGCELNPQYEKLQAKRIASVQPVLGM